MSTVSFTLHTAPISVNQLYYNDRKLGYTAAAKAWVREIQEQLSKPSIQQKIKSIKSAYKPKSTGFSVSFTAYYPNFFTKSGAISAHTQDCSNFEKALLDVLFLPKYATEFADNIGVDDRFVVELRSAKKPGSSDVPYIEVSISVVEVIEKHDSV